MCINLCTICTSRMFGLEEGERAFTGRFEVGLSFSRLGVFDVFHEAGDGDGSKNTDNGNDDHQFDEGKAFLIHFHKSVSCPKGRFAV